MSDQNNPYAENTNPQVEVNPVSAVTATPSEPSVPPPPSVVVPNGGGGVPKWFYFIFGVTIIVFLLVTTLLVLQFTQKPANNLGVVPTTAPKVTSTTGFPTPTLAAGATDSAVIKLNDVGSSDEVALIEADLKTTDLTVLDQAMVEVDNQANSSF